MTYDRSEPSRHAAPAILRALCLLLALLILTTGAGAAGVPHVADGTALEGGRIAFASQRVAVLDNRSGAEGRIRLEAWTGDAITALQFRIVNTSGHLRFEGVALGDSLAAAGGWHLSYAIARGPLQPDFGACDTIAVVLFSLNHAAFTAGSWDDLLRFTYAVSDIATPFDSTALAIGDITGSLRDGGDVVLLAGPLQSILIMNTVAKGDLDGNDDVDINDILGLIQVILGRETLDGAAFARADIAPWPEGDGRINVRDLVVTQRVVLDGAYPDGTVFGAPAGQEGLAPRQAMSGSPASPDVKIVAYVHAGGIALHMTNNRRVKGIQVEFNNIAIVPDTVKLRTIFDPGPSWNRTVSNVLVLLIHNEAAIPVDQGAQYVSFLAFPIQNPLQVNLKKLIVADEKNNKIENVEISIVYGAPNGVNDVPLPSASEIRAIYPNPFRSRVSVATSVRERSRLMAAVHASSGAVVRTLSSGTHEAGEYIFEWDGRSDAGAELPSGVYWFSLSGSGASSIRPIVLVR